MRKTRFECFALGCVLWTSIAWADTDDTVSLSVGAGIMRDDNLFRAPAGGEVSDEIRTTNFGLRFNKMYSRQRFVIDATVTDYKYRDNRYLDYTGNNVMAAWAWRLTPYLHGNLSTTRSKSLNSFVDYVAAAPALRRNIRTMERSRFDVEWEALGPIHLISGVSHWEQKNSEAFFEESGFSAKSAELGVKYVTRADGHIALVTRKTNGDYNRTANAANLADSGFDQTETEARFVWNPTVKTNVTGRLAYLDRKHDNFSVRDYDGYVGGVDVKWGFREKLEFLFSAKRDLNSYQERPSLIDSFSDNYIADTLSVGPVWKISEKTSLSYRHTRQHRDFRGVRVGNDPLRDDRLRYDSINFDWSPRAYAQIGLDYQKIRRDSNDDRFDFKTNVLYLTLRLNF